MQRLLRRIEIAIRELDLGIAESKFSVDFLGAVNAALRLVGGAQINTLEDEGILRRVAVVLEGAL